MTEAKKAKLTAVFVCVFVISLFQYTNTVSIPVIADIIASMPKYPITTVLWFQTLPSVGCIIGPIIYSSLVNKISSKTLVIIACAIVAIFGTLPAFLGTNLALMLVCRFIFGIGAGFIFAAPKVLINANMDARTGARWMGFLEVFGSIGMIFFQTASGYIGLIDWHYSMFLCLIMILVAIAVGIALPARNDPGSKAYVPLEGTVNAKQVGTQSGEKLSFSQKYPALVIFYWIYIFVFVSCIFAFQSNTSVLIASLRIGASSDAGMVLSVHTIIGMIGGILFGTIFNKIREFAIPLAALLGAVAFLVVFFTASLPGLYVGGGILGFAAPMLCAACFQLSGRNAAASASALAVSIALAFQNLGVIAQPYYMTGIMNLAGLNATAGKDTFLVSGIICVVLTVVSLVTAYAAYKSMAKSYRSSNGVTEAA